MSDEGKNWPGYTGECNPDTWNLNAKPSQPTEKKIGQLTEDQINEYFTKGVVLVDNYFEESELEPIKESISGLVSKLANVLYSAGKITEKYENLGLFSRLTALNKDFPGANIILHKMGVMPETIQSLWSGDKLCHAMEQLIGPDIAGHPVWNLRTKTPQDEATTVPWHQDCAYLDQNSYNVHQPTAWIPLLDATPENGCMEFAVKGHKLGKIAMHQCCDGETHYVMLEPETMADQLGVDLENDIKAMPVKYGSVLFFNNCIPHRSLNNMSDEIRWSLDLRWQDPNKPYSFHGLAEGIRFRKADDPAWRPSEDDWYDFLKIPRESKYKKQFAKQDEESTKQYNLDTTIVGPWMKNWEITHMNRHTAGLKDATFSTWHDHSDA